MSTFANKKAVLQQTKLINVNIHLADESKSKYNSVLAVFDAEASVCKSDSRGRHILVKGECKVCRREAGIETSSNID